MDGLAANVVLCMWAQCHMGTRQLQLCLCCVCCSQPCCRRCRCCCCWCFAVRVRHCPHHVPGVPAGGGGHADPPGHLPPGAEASAARMVERVKEMAEDPLMLAAVRLSAVPQHQLPPTAASGDAGGVAPAAVQSVDGGTVCASTDGFAWLALGAGLNQQPQARKEGSLDGAARSSWWRPQWTAQTVATQPASGRVTFWPGARVAAAPERPDL